MHNIAAHAIHDLWEWFRADARTIAADIENPASLRELDLRVTSLGEGISWEIGPGRHKPWHLVISPNLDRDLRETTRLIVAKAPDLDDWEFYSAKQPKDSKYQVETVKDSSDEVSRIDANNWRFVLVQYPDGFREILIESPDLSCSTRDELTQIGELVLVSLLGEDAFLDSIDGFELVDRLEPRFSERARPIRELSSAVTGRER